MAAGKTTLAQALARRLGWRAEDVDVLIEARERRTIAEIFARDGETATSAPSSDRSSGRCCRSVILSLRQVAARSSIRKIAPRSTPMACRCGLTCRSRCC